MPLLSIFISTKETPEWVATEKHFYKVVLFHVTLKDFFCICLPFTVQGIYTVFGICREPAISLHSHHVSLVPWTTRLLPVMRDPGLNPQRDTYVKPGFSC
jgi:hypothetical protein